MAKLLSAQPAVALVDVSRPDGMSVLELGSHICGRPAVRRLHPKHVWSIAERASVPSEAA
jgi:hypothetical protein